VLDGPVFTATAHQVAPGTTVTTDFIGVNDGVAPTVTNSTTTVVRTALENPPTYGPSYLVDLIKASGANEQAAAHFIDHGFEEVVAQYTDLIKAFATSSDAGAVHYVDYGFSEGRSTGQNVAAYGQAYPNLEGKYFEPCRNRAFSHIGASGL
jgi:SAM-dependent MidA family methyltransferase